MAHHVGIGKIADDKIVLLAADRGDQLVGHLESTHLGLEVIGCHVGGRHQHAILAGKGHLFAAVEEKGDVRIFLSFRDAQLA